MVDPLILSRRRALQNLSWTFLIAMVLWAVAPLTARSQSPEARDVVAEARHVRDAGDLSDAARLLKAHLARHPDGPDALGAARLLAQTLYWLKDVAGARSMYETTLAKHPEDTALRLGYGRMLVETGGGGQAREVLAPLERGEAAVRAEAETLLGTLAYSEGDWSAARRHFAAALRADPNKQEARRKLREILIITAPWARTTMEARHDDQLGKLAFDAQVGWFATPPLSLTARVRPMLFRMGDSATRTHCRRGRPVVLRAGTESRNRAGGRDPPALLRTGVRLDRAPRAGVEGARIR